MSAGDPRPFAGVPTAVKDITASKHHPLTMGSDLFGDFAPGFHSHALRRLEESGLVPIGQTTVPELGIVNVTEGRRYGPTRNPWDPSRTPGGSSGGAAAAVAGGAFSIAHGSDGGGSLRIPAACCGLVGLKPSRGRVSSGPVLGESMLVQDGVLTRTVADTAEALDVLAGYELGDASWAPPPAEPFADGRAPRPGHAADRRGAGGADRRAAGPRVRARRARGRRAAVARWGTRWRRSTRRGWAATCCPRS